MAAGITGLIASGWYMAGLDSETANKYDLYPLHKSFGVLIILTLIARIALRLLAQRHDKIPAAPAELKVWEKQASHAAHLSLYALMAAVPVSGYVMSGSYEFGHGINFFWTMLPDLVPKAAALFETAKSLHGPLAYGLTALVAIHVAAVIKHRAFDAKAADVLPRMLRKSADC